MKSAICRQYTGCLASKVEGTARTHIPDAATFMVLLCRDNACGTVAAARAAAGSGPGALFGRGQHRGLWSWYDLLVESLARLFVAAVGQR